ncbi:splicing factor, Prp19-binding domain-containing protein [Blyttiomyces helicus]|uniref:Splicing factor, Prp19-binding domain-containing protein n=1 Tax=Blyttiomyces helicus TaxID=388810 RepID=A0A4P9WIL5_9FUNG|nr:splicing factor, Prp19-binding domain-containing protein [Blyttiomyces helicus]|eukprot:RKO91733.1 splicing factor, Prp19-binding domain-containing protein [Blyttiomyces helicus]
MSSAKPPGRNRPVRYWPGKAPKEAQAASDSESDSDQDLPEDALKQRSVKTEEITEVSLTSAEVQSDRRLRRLMQTSKDAEADGGEEIERPGRRAQAVSQVKAEDTKADQESEEEDEDAVARRRNRIREKALLRQQEEEAAAKAKQEEEEEEEEDEYTTDYTTDSEDEPVASRTLMKPVFIPKAQRETILEQERLDKEREEAAELKAKQLEERRLESHEMVAEELRKEMAAVQVNNDPIDVDDTDGLDEEEEYAAWKLRELRRIKRDREEKDRREAEEADLQRRRNMTDAQLAAENARLGLNAGSEKAKRKFMQKYYHKGAFYTDDDKVNTALQTRNFSEPTLEDHFNKESLPSVMQVKNFGRAGQTKYTHLKDQDTTQLDSAWAQQSEVNKRTWSKMGGMKAQSFDKPGKRRRA